MEQYNWFNEVNLIIFCLKNILSTKLLLNEVIGNEIKITKLKKQFIANC